MASRDRWVCRAAAVGLFLAAAASLGVAQQTARPLTLTPTQIEEFRRNPELIRDRIRESGLTSGQVRSLLRGAGYPESLLDAYLTGQSPQPVPAPGLRELSALEALGLPFTLSERALPVDTGLIDHFGLPSRVFGVDAFRRSTTQFLPVLAGPVPSDYLLGPGDALVLIITGDVELTHALTVSRDGFILIPQVGQVQVDNLTLDQLRDVLYTRLGRVYSGVRRVANPSTTFDVSVTNIRVNQVFVIGEVTQPGAYQISALGGVLTALYAAGGLTENAMVRRIEVRRHDESVATMDLYDYLLRGDTKSDIRLETGDVVFVPVHGPRVAVEGAVVRPGIYELAPTDELADVLDAAGGMQATADLRRLTIHRVLAPAQRGPGATLRAAIDVELRASADTNPGARMSERVRIPSVAIQEGDSIVLHELPTLEESYFVRIAGRVLRPGVYPWREGMTLRDLVALAGGPTVGADLREVEIARMPAQRAGGQLADVIRVPLDSSYIMDRDASGRYVGPPGAAFPPPGATPDVELAVFDQVLILAQPEFELQRTVTITGEVQFPGNYTLRRKDERLSDLVQRAGGFLPTAYPEGARFIRPLNDAGRVDVDIRVALVNPAGRRDIVLQPGDSLDIPEFIPTVRVIGAVNSPTSVLFRQGEGLDYYIGNAGGYAHNADKGRVSVRYANGSARVKSRFLFFSSSPAPGPGSTVLVPIEQPGGGINATQLLAAVAQILASTVAIIAIATR